MSDSICTGSHLNQRTFKEDEYWASFQSTIVSGQVMNADMETSVDELSTLIEDEMTEENPLNMNLDVIPNSDPDDKFYDCPSFEKSPANLMKISSTNTPSSNNLNNIFSPRPYHRPELYTVQFSSPPDNNNNSKNNSNNIDYLASPRKRRPENARRISPSQSVATSMSSDSLSPSVGTRTGSLLVQAIVDFNDLKDHAQSTPKLSSDSGNPSSYCFSDQVTLSNSVDHVRKVLDYQNTDINIVSTKPSVSSNTIDQRGKTFDVHNADTIITSSEKELKNEQLDFSESNKENFYNGKYSNFVTTRKSAPKSPVKVWTRSGKVALLKEYFQNRANESSNQCNKLLQRSRIPMPIRKSSQLLLHVKRSPQAKSRTSGSPSYQTRKSYKLVSSRSSSISKSHHPSTAITFSSNGNESFLTRNQRKLSRTSRVQSCSDATDAEITSIDESCKSHSTGDLPSDSTASIKASQSSKITTRTNLKIGRLLQQSRRLSPKRISAIQSRRSVSMLLKNNTSPVKPVRELCKLFTPQKRTRGNVSHKIVPKIVISHL